MNMRIESSIIGQHKLLERLRADFIHTAPPRLSLIFGDEGAGKTLIANKIADEAGYAVVNAERPAKIQELRNIIELAYKIPVETAYIISDVDKISAQAQTSLLKVIEEPPNNAIFILTARDEMSVLETIKSRAVKYRTYPYKKSELTDYLDSLIIIEPNSYKSFIQSICYTPGDINKLVENLKDNEGVAQFCNYVLQVLENIATVSGANALKIGSKINFKNDNDKYNLIFFLRLFAHFCADFAMQYITNDEVKDERKALIYYKVEELTLVALRKAQNISFNKQMIFDEWVLEVRKAWR